MKTPRHPTLIEQQLHARVKQLQAKGPLLAASLVAVQKKCGRPGCHCLTGPGHPGFFLTLKEKGKTRTVYVPQDLLPEVRQWIAEYKRIKPLIRQITQLALARIQTHVKSQRRKAGRS
jgi:hypothetical protein